ncbi:AAA family ATPase [Saccharibacillus sp. JS10]|uniref:AAA family ATPase n=1 Tax=Saccharibacillus sp. JS10 TaxID=2950552 RepID=UPI00210C6712|nr:AAA family ATPase [Saccharibacillus sp. JS10]MCQ4088650.1 AAA family ATPase [Saccharibacillus sp. JS10]
MSNSWDLHVTNFGRIREATITVSPFMMFVGKNNSGKSYMMQLLWGIINEVPELMGRTLSKSHQFDDLISYIKPQFMKNGLIEIDHTIQNKLFGILNEFLKKYKDELVKKIFNFDISIDELEIQFEKPSSVFLKVEDHEFIKSFKLVHIYYNNEFKISIPIEEDESLSEEIKYLLYFILSIFLTDNSFDSNSLFVDHDRDPIYFPASRSGFMQTYRAIVGNVFEDRLTHSFYSNENYSSISGTQLTLPVTRFIAQLQKHNFNSKNREKYAEEIAFLNNQLLGGEIEKDESQQFRFRSTQDQQTYPLHVTSSLISELTPISIFLSAQNDPNLWIIEEVESHLHSEMQLRMARFLFRMINKGKSVWITTHSDNLAQQINNLLAISQHPNKQGLLRKLEYEETDILADLSTVNAYQFEVEGEHTVVKKLELGRNGFVIDTFNDTLKKLIVETDMIQNYTE